MASSYEEELYYSEEIVTKVHVYVPYIWSLFMIAHFSCVSVFVTTLHYPTKDHSCKVLLVDLRLPPFPSFFHQSCCVAQADF